jgi:hypothetical protein
VQQQSFLRERAAAICANKAVEGFLFLSITFPKFAASTPNIFASVVNPISSRFAFNHASAAMASCYRVRDLLVILPAASAIRLRSSSVTS